MSEKLADALTELREEDVLNEVEALKEGETPALEIIQRLQEGMRRVGEKFESEEYFLSELIMSAEIFKQAIASLEDDLSGASTPENGTIVIGTIFGDIHDIGKNVVSTVLGCNGFKVVDLGVEVPTEKFIEAIKEHNPKVVGISCLLTTAFNNIKTTIETLEKEGLRKNLKIFVGGGPVDQSVCDYVGADGFGKNAQEAVTMAKGE